MTLGVDANGIYLSVFYFHYDEDEKVVDGGHSAVGIKKPQIYADSLVYTTLFTDPGEIDTQCIQPAVNFDNPPQDGQVWFVSKGPPQLGPPYQGGAIFYRRVHWTGNSIQWTDNNWTRSVQSSAYRDYLDYDKTNSVVHTNHFTAPQAGSTVRVDLHGTGSRLMMAVIRNNYLWTCHHVGLDGTDGDYDGDKTASTADRSGIQWLKLQTRTDGDPSTYATHGRVFDTVASNPNWYYMPSLMVNSAGDMLLGFSGSRTSEYIGCFSIGRLANGTFPDRLNLIQAGRSSPSVRWGDYSYTSLDPVDGLSFWTVQEYSENHAESDAVWGTWISSIKISP